MTHPLQAIARAIDPDITDYADDHERQARAIERARFALRALAEANMPYSFTHGGVKVSVDPAFISMVRSMLREVAGHA